MTRIRKSKPGKVHVGKPIPARGWMPFKVYIVRAYHFASGQRARAVCLTLEAARKMMTEFVKGPYDVAELKESIQLGKRGKRA